MSSYDLPLQDVLTAIELREAELLSWGAVSAQWSEEELLSLLNQFGDPEIILGKLKQSALVVETPSGHFRTRSAETIRVLATLKQAFPGKRVSGGAPLVLDYRYLNRPRRRPRRDVPASNLVTQVEGKVGSKGIHAAEQLLPETISEFQSRSTVAILDALNSKSASGVVITAGTGSGKTLAFYLPLLTWLANQPQTGRSSTLALALYPRNELLKDQLRALLRYAMRLDSRAAQGDPVLSLATWFGPTPRSAFYVKQGWSEGWSKRSSGYVCPFLRCLECDKDLQWLNSDIDSKTERLVCTDRDCDGTVEGRYLRLTRDSARTNPAKVMLSTTESLNRQMSAPGNLHAFGISPASLVAVLLDEVHTYEGTTGAQNALLLRRLEHRLGKAPVWVGLSATLRNAGEFFGRLVGLPVGDILVVHPRADELEDSGAEYLLALRHDPHSRTGTLSTTIQTCMALARSLDSMHPNPFNPPPSSDLVFGSRLFAFADKLDSTNRLYWDLLDAEGWAWPGKASSSKKPLTLAHLRSQHQERMREPEREAAESRDPAGQWWWMADHLGHDIEGDVQLEVGRTSSQDRGVAGEASVVVATATLEVGFDDERVGAVLQHKAPHDAAQFLQRKGRAGRHAATRPWTVVVLSDWGRDREAWDGYDALFDPELAPRNLPIENLYVIRIQSVYALLDWLAVELGYVGNETTWGDLAGPAIALESTDKNRAQTRARQERLAAFLSRLLRDGPERQRLRRHLQRALSLGRDVVGDSVVDSVFWEAPRPLISSVIPTMRRRLEDQWAGEEPLPGDSGVRTRTPLRQFVPGNLFDELLVPDVEFQVPSRSNEEVTDHLPGLRALGEFCPGNVTRHFGVWASNKRHWIPIPDDNDSAGRTRVDLLSTYRALPVEVLHLDGREIPVYVPTAATLQPVPPGTKDASSVRPQWELDAKPLGEGASVRLAHGVRTLLDNVDAHIHAQGGGMRIIRFARTASGSVWDPSEREVQLTFGLNKDGDWAEAGLGMDMQCDALDCAVRLPTALGTPDAAERSEWLRECLVSGPDLPSAMSTFDRNALSDVTELAAAQMVVADQSWNDTSIIARALLSAAASLGVGDNTGAAPSSIDTWLRDPQVIANVAGALTEVSNDQRSLSWQSWARLRYTMTAGQVVLAALARMCAGVDADDLTLDIDPSDSSRFIVSETSPGGTGQIEAFVRALAEDPEGFARALEDVMQVSELELLDAQLGDLLRSDDPTVAAALAQLRDSWQVGHSAVTEATVALDETLTSANLDLGRSARTALATRLAGPGAHDQLLSQALRWLEIRDSTQNMSGLEVTARTLGGILSSDATVDQSLHLSEPTPSRRAQAISNVLWPWGTGLQPDLTYNPYAKDLHPRLSYLRQYVEFEALTIEITEWNEQTRSDVHESLRTTGELRLVATKSQRRALRAAMIDLQDLPVEVGALFCHPVVVGVSERNGMFEARLMLRESL